VASEHGDQDHFGSEGRALVLRGEPALQYQPVVDLASGGLLGFEALLRWHHPTQGLILPGLLIPWAEANGDIVALGQWVLEQSCRNAAAWPPSVQLAVNLSIVQLRRGVGSEAVRGALEQSGLPADRLTVEVTEHVMSDELAIRDLRSIAAMGVQLAVDDVGTSWNSFENLRRMAVNTIKIDASFVNGLEAREGINRMVVETVVHLAHSSGMSTVAEGVETELHARLVREFDSDAAQGYFFAPPLEVERALAMAIEPGFRFPLDGSGWAQGGTPWLDDADPAVPAPDSAGVVRVVGSGDDPENGWAAALDAIPTDPVDWDEAGAAVTVDGTPTEASDHLPGEGPYVAPTMAPADAAEAAHAAGDADDAGDAGDADDADDDPGQADEPAGTGARRPAAHAKPRTRRRRPRSTEEA
jgi:EAL domain-containing protein (putative c-di-GMP-specific phosphodiesterase class I)